MTNLPYIPREYKQLHDKKLRELTKPLEAGGLPLGQMVEPRTLSGERNLALTSDMRQANPHVLIVDSRFREQLSLLSRMIAHDIASKRCAVVLLDSTGDLADLITQWISVEPAENGIAERIVRLDLTQPWDTLQFSENWQPHATKRIAGALKRVPSPDSLVPWTEEQTSKILRNAVLLLLTLRRSLDDLPAVLQDDRFRESLIEQLESGTKAKAEQALISVWRHYHRLSQTEQWIAWTEPILVRADGFIQNIRRQKVVEGYDLKRLLTERKILVLKRTNDDALDFLSGSCLLLKIKSAVLELANHCPSVSIYADALHSFIDENVFDEIVDESLKNRIGLICATWSLQTIPESFRNSLLINCGTIAAFSLYRNDAEVLGPMFFRLDGRSKLSIQEQKLYNINRLISQEPGTFYCYRTALSLACFAFTWVKSMTRQSNLLN